MNLREGYAFLIAMALIMAMQPTSAHLAAGIDRNVSGYTADFGYDPAVPQAGQAAAMEFSLSNSTTGETVHITGLWLRISRGDEVIFAGDMLPKYDAVALSYRFPLPGKYQITARFSEGNRTMAETSYDLEAAGSRLDTIRLDTTLTIGVFVALLLAFILIRRRAMKRKRGITP